MPKKKGSKVKNDIKNRQKKKRKAQKRNEEIQKKKEAKKVADRELYHQKQKEEIEIVSTMYELKPVSTPGQTPQPQSSGHVEDTEGNKSEESEKYSNIFDMEVLARPGETEKNHCSIILRVRSFQCIHCSHIPLHPILCSKLDKPVHCHNMKAL